MTLTSFPRPWSKQEGYIQTLAKYFFLESAQKKGRQTKYQTKLTGTLYLGTNYVCTFSIYTPPENERQNRTQQKDISFHHCKTTRLPFVGRSIRCCCSEGRFWKQRRRYSPARKKNGRPAQRYRMKGGTSNPWQTRSRTTLLCDVACLFEKHAHKVFFYPMLPMD